MFFLEIFCLSLVFFFFFFNDTATTEIYTLSLHDALPICHTRISHHREGVKVQSAFSLRDGLDRKSTRLNSSHLVISYAVFCLKKKKKISLPATRQRQYQVLFSLPDNRLNSLHFNRQSPYH